jgi:hypothetical protein
MQHLALRRLLRVLAVLAALAGLWLLFASDWFFFALPVLPADASVRTALVLVVKAFGAVAFAMSWLLYAASNDPARYVAVIDAFAATLVILAVIDLYTALVLHFTWALPAWLVWLRTALRIGLAIALLVLRPKTVSPRT